MIEPRIMPVLGRFSALGHIASTVPLANAGGFSGSELWKIVSSNGEFVLRRWPDEHPSCGRLAFIHAYQRHLRDAGLAFVPALLATADGATIVECNRRLWELASWMPGRADYREHPSPARLAAAMTSLARIHQAAVQMPGQFHIGSSPGLAARLAQLRQLLAGGIERIEAAVSRRSLPWDDFAGRICRRFRQFAPQVERETAAAETITGPLFPCLRDIWHDHVLFTGEEVTGVIDYGAGRIESPAGDIARLVGSLVGDDAHGWRTAVAVYETLRPLDAGQRQLTQAFDSSGVLLAGINWLTWLYVEEREFEDAEAIAKRLTAIVSRT